MPNESGRGLAAALTAIAAIVLIGGTWLLVESYDSGSDIQTVTATAAAPAPASQEPRGIVPVGGVATGGGGTAGEPNSSVVVPVLTGLAVVALVGYGGMVLRQRPA